MMLTTFKIFLWKHYKSTKMKWISTLLNFVFVIGFPWFIMSCIADGTYDQKRLSFEICCEISSRIYMFVVVNMLVVPTIEEKSLGIREFLRIATTHYQLNLISFYVLNVLFGVLMFGTILLLGQIYGFLVFACVPVLFHVLIFVASTAAYAYLVTVPFSKTLSGRISGYMLLVIPSVLPHIKSVKWLSPLFSINMFIEGWIVLGQQLDSISSVPSGENLPHTLLTIWCIIAADLLAYVLLYTYLVQVFPGPYGTPQPFHFPALRVMQWCRANVTTDKGLRDNEMDSVRNRCAEPVVRVRGLTKEYGHLFGQKHRAVNNVDMDIGANQITVLLGHNGAGKTTAMSIISGVIAKTSGEISVNGERDVNKYRKDIGFCPQHNVFLPYFTCLEHLIFFGVLRGLSEEESIAKSRTLLDRLKLLTKANEYGKNLSGGMKRRLCLGIALIGDTKIAILDEPSSGLDPESRRELWNILIEMRKATTIMITTHYMEEAETLADYISIMSRGEILCHGTAQQLKRRYADGYVLKLLTNDQFETVPTMAKLRKHIPGANVKSYVKPTLSVTLPYSHVDKYSKALVELENVSTELGIESFGLSNASLEEVFLNSDPQHKSPEEHELHRSTHDSNSPHDFMPIGLGKLCIQQVIAILYIKSMYLRRHWIHLLICVSMLALAAFIGIRIMENEKWISYLLYTLLTPTALFFYILFYASMPFDETNTEFKQLQIIPSSLYWATYYAFDAAQHFLICVLLFCLHLAVDWTNALTTSEHGQLFGLYVMYGLTYLPLIYLVAQIFGSRTSMYSFYSYTFIGSTVSCLILCAGDPEYIDKYVGWSTILFMLPDYAIQHSIHTMFYGHFEVEINRTVYDLAIYYQITSIIAMLSLVVLVLEHIYRRDAVARILRLYRPIWRAVKCFKKTARMPTILNTIPTQDVDREREQTDAVVRAHKEADYAIVVTRLRKLYDGFAAVRGVNFVVPRGECFGLLGMNGAGKSTTFKMMVRQLTITEGAIYFNGLNSRAEESRYRHQFGYCPQTDALHCWMTAHETLKYMSLARGSSWAAVDDQVQKLMRKTDLASYADVTVQNMSGGTKRKLNTAIAIQSDPLLVFLDEPTTGVDPSSRRFMWACIQECQRQNKNIVLTSHSMDECEFLCNRLAIMNHGQLNCIGPIQQLKRSFALGFLVTVHLRDGQAGTADAAQMRQNVLDRFQCVLREEYGNQLTFLAQNNMILWSEVFRNMVALQQQFDHVMEDISLSESSLEDIFLKIARQTPVDIPEAV